MNPEGARAAVLAGPRGGRRGRALRRVHARSTLIVALRPDVLVKGSDYAEGDIVGAAEVRGWGGRVLRAPLLEGYSTTEMLDRIGPVSSD